jgi:PRTRC genetic system protein A
MSDLAAAFAALVQHRVLTTTAGPAIITHGVAWLWAADGIYKQGHDGQRTVTVQVAATPPIPGLRAILPGIAWAAYPQRLPSRLLHAILLHARKAHSTEHGGLHHPIEQQYHITLEDGMLMVRVPPQQAHATRVRYAVPSGTILVDVHSHHTMPAYFSSTDDRDDTGLGVSVVIGHIHTEPEIAVRVCCYGAWQRMPALSIFDGLGPFRDTYEVLDAATYD